MFNSVQFGRNSHCQWSKIALHFSNPSYNSNIQYYLKRTREKTVPVFRFNRLGQFCSEEQLNLHKIFVFIPLTMVDNPPKLPWMAILNELLFSGSDSNRYACVALN